MFSTDPLEVWTFMLIQFALPSAWKFFSLTRPSVGVSPVPRTWRGGGTHGRWSSGSSYCRADARRSAAGQAESQILEITRNTGRRRNATRAGEILFVSGKHCTVAHPDNFRGDPDPAREEAGKS